MRPRNTNLALITAMALIVSLAGCARDPGVLVRTIGAAPEVQSPWVGHTRAELVAAWGEPSATETDGEDEVLVYERDRAVQLDVEDNPATPENEEEPNRDDSINRKAVARFWIGTDGKIHRVWLDQELYTKGYPRPGSAPQMP